MSRKKRGVKMYNTHSNGYYKPEKATNGHHHPAAKTGWNTGDAPAVCTECSWMPKNSKTTIHVDAEVWRVLLAICTRKKVEWQALLSGTIEADGKVVVTGYHIPQQTVTAASVKNLAVIDDVFIAAHNIVAGIHSHGNMGVFFSSTDVEHTNMSLIKHNIVINNKSEYKAQSRVELPCGLVKFVDAEVFTINDTPVEIVGLDNIKEVSYGFTTGGKSVIDTGEYLPYMRDDEMSYNLADYSTPESSAMLIEDGHRWCPICSMMPEEDGGLCSCHTKGLRMKLPAFNLFFYEKTHGRSYELRYPVALKYMDY